MITKIITLSKDTIIDAVENCQYLLLVKDFDSDKKYNFTLNMVKSGVEVEIIGIFNLRPNYGLTLDTWVNHINPDTKCETRIKAVLDDKARLFYTGKIIINKKAQNTNSFLDTKTLVVGDNTINNSQPILQIDANDVKASHGSATGRIDKEQIYYLTSRGYNKNEAISLIIQGFFESEINKIYDDGAKKAVLESINK